MTFLELFAQVYMSPQEVSIEAGVPIETIHRARNAQPIREQEARRIVRAVSTRLAKPVNIYELPHEHIIWE
jgi:hypothetical protein